MAWCTFDNPATMARECWKDGVLVASYLASVLPPFAKRPIPSEYLFYGANIGPWQNGRIVGDKAAIGAEYQHLA